MKKLFTSIICLTALLCSNDFLWAQNQAFEMKLPPGYYLNPYHITIDFSYKLEGRILEKPITYEMIKVLKEIPESQLSETSLEYQNYYHQGKLAIDNLSSGVKSLYTNDELWYIYAFDHNLFRKLQQQN